MESQTKIIGVLVSYNPELNDLDIVLSSIASQLDWLVVVDNGSLADVLPVCEKHGNVECIKLNENIGLAAAQNFGVNLAIENEASHVLFFDQDSVIDDLFVRNLLSAESKLISSGVKVGAVGPSFFDPVTEEKYPATVYWGPFIKRVCLAETPVPATYIISSGSLVRVEVLKDVGSMMEAFFIDYIDVEWCLRARDHGYTVFMIPSAKMSHEIGDNRVSILGRSISIHGAIRRYYLFRNSFLMLRLGYVPIGYKIREIFFNFVRFGLGLFLSKKKAEVLKYSSWAFWDGIRGKFGPIKH